MTTAQATETITPHWITQQSIIAAAVAAAKSTYDETEAYDNEIGFVRPEHSWYRHEARRVARKVLTALGCKGDDHAAAMVVVMDCLTSTR
jgi:hypothetical protein